MKTMKEHKHRMVEDDYLVQYWKNRDNYEEEYHEHSHEHLLNDKSYYLARADIAKLKYFKDVTDERVLDFGCGIGQSIALLENAWGHDKSRFALTKAKEKGVKVLGNLKDCKDFDIVFSRHVLEHCEEPAHELRKMRDCLRENGRLILVLPIERQKKVPLRLSQNQHIYGWNFQTINNLLVKTRFKPVVNRYTRGTGYQKLQVLHKISLPIYSLATYLASFYSGSKEMIIEAIKE